MKEKHNIKIDKELVHKLKAKYPTRSVEEIIIDIIGRHCESPPSPSESSDEEAQ